MLNEKGTWLVKVIYFTRQFIKLINQLSPIFLYFWWNIKYQQNSDRINCQ
ncbi:hypothetical protein XSR1_210003 [Xenorhabdus szentirmaii DSM 16338]|uniref:Uncharacterized protein n=1 Tax=Xenorhabdus szentirmaii DSM 16338 TaxID=1427518 RepID=W1IZD0_9GAMM|nr:hypothetical protein XSR1_210003 [Xenorhabdus szentirmaii DSM 16338]